MTAPAPATLPPPGLPGLDPRWSRLVQAPDAHGVVRTWHLLDTGAPADGTAPRVTLLCVHGNPTWSYLWRRLLADAPADWRVVAVDQLEMGWSERTGTPRRLADRIADLGGLTDALGLPGPVVTVAHDWGGPISLGWAERHRDHLLGVVLANTAVHQPEGAPAPTLIRAARASALLPAVTCRTPMFVRGTTALSRPRPPREVRDAFAAPYDAPERRLAVQEFVADIPLEPDHPSMPALQQVAAGLADLRDLPALLLWGPEDPVFSDRYLRDLVVRLPRADVHRYEGASHLVTEDAPRAVADILTWVTDLLDGRATAAEAGISDVGAEPGRRPLWDALDRRAEDDVIAVVEMAGAGTVARRVPWRLLSRVVRDLAAGLRAEGVEAGDRVAVLVPPGADLTAVVYACWRAGAVPVVVDRGLGPAGMRRALRGAGPRHAIGIAPGLALARSVGVRGLTVLVGGASPAVRRALRVDTTLPELAALGADRSGPAVPGPGDDALVVFTSGATGPSKGVVYRHGQLEAQRDALQAAYRITADDALVAAFAPWAVLGPSLGISSVVPDMDITAPSTLTARSLADAVRAVGGTMVWASPAALVNLVATAGDITDTHRDALATVRLLMSAGAPVRPDLLRDAAALVPNASAHTPYGMTEALPVADVTLDEIDRAATDPEGSDPRGGVCVGHPVLGVEVAIAPFDEHGWPDGPPQSVVGVSGEICVRSPHVKDRYDRLWATERRSGRDPGWHRTGDVGRVDDQGRLWVEGRLAHVIRTSDGVLTPVGVEHRVEGLPDVALAAAVGVGPPGTQQVVVLVTRAGAPAVRRPMPADADLADRVRAAAGVPVAAVVVLPRMPVDRRHNSKIDRGRLADWAARYLSGERARTP